VRHLPVLRDGRAVGMVSARDVLSALAPPTG
jgi:CBS domain-containing protein